MHFIYSSLLLAGIIVSSLVQVFLLLFKKKLVAVLFLYFTWVICGVFPYFECCILERVLAPIT